jgi:hypothetical protein
MKVVINKCYGGFGLSTEARDGYITRKGINPSEYSALDIKRDDPVLVRVVEELGDYANRSSSKLAVVEIPDELGDNWYISDYDGIEEVHETHRIWR